MLEAVYGAYAIDWQTAGPAIESLSGEALHLALVLAELLPDEPEALGLAALVCLSESRRGARRSVDGAFVPLDEQDPGLWDPALIARGEALLRRAHGFNRPGRYQYEAAIQSAHGTRPVDWVALRILHRALLRTAPSLGAAVALAAVDAEVDGPQTGLAHVRRDHRSRAASASSRPGRRVRTYWPGRATRPPQRRPTDGQLS